MVSKRIGVLLDRDGVIAEQVHHLHRKDQLRIIAGAAESIRQLRAQNLVVVVITNQAVVARGLCTESEVAEIHEELRRMLQQAGADVDAIYYCPHHEDAFLPMYRRACEDRKPGPGLVYRAAKEWNLDLPNSFLVGDRTVDIQSGNTAGCKTILVRTGYGGSDGLCTTAPDYICDDLKDATGLILQQCCSSTGPKVNSRS